MSEQIDIAIQWGRAQLEQVSSSPKLDAEILLGFCLDKPRSYLYSWPERSLEQAVWQAFQDLIAARALPTPIAYLVGEREFYSLTFATTPAALVPRPETELLVDTALKLCAAHKPVDMLDLGTGTGIIAITMKKLRPNASLTATDISADCLQLARQNAEKHAVEINFIESDWFRQIREDLKFDFILSNPPYIAAAHSCLKTGDLAAEPILALSSGSSGLEALRDIIKSAAAYLKPRGYLILEHGYDQQAAVAQLLAAQHFSQIVCLKDNASLARVSLGRIMHY